MRKVCGQAETIPRALASAFVDAVMSKLMSLGLYRYRAEECAQKAELTADPAERASWLSLASKWRRLATEVRDRQLQRWGVSEERTEVGASNVQHFAFSAGTIRQH
jgi:hypothetical protein